MSGAPKVRSLNASEESDTRLILGPAGNKTRSPSITRKPASKLLMRVKSAVKDERKDISLVSSLSAPSSLLLRSNFSLNASCSSDASTDSFCSRASTGRIGRVSYGIRRRQVVPRPEKIVPDGEVKDLQGKRRCAWVTANTDPCYAAFHDEEWGVPVHDDRKLFELLALSGALAELPWPAILGKRRLFREAFMDFDPVAVSKLNEKKVVSPVLSEPKLRAIVENARQVLKIVEEFGSFDRYCWGFVNYKPIAGGFRYPRRVPVKTPKAEAISRDLVGRGFRSVGPTVVYTFMQVAGLTNDHLVGCYRFDECAVAAAGTNCDEGLELMRGVDGLGVSSS